MKRIFTWFTFVGSIAICPSHSCEYGNATATLQPAQRQLCDFGYKHPNPIGVLTTTAGRAVDIRETITLNSEVLSNEFILDTMLHFDEERVPERVVHAKGTAALGYFQVTHDVSHYTSADVFNGVGKKTPLVVRLSSAAQSLGGPDVSRDLRGFAIKFYTKEGNLDLLCIHTPVYFYRDPLHFNSFVHAFKRNPATNLFDTTSQWDFLTLRPETLHAFFYIQSDYGLPLTYRNMDVFPIHTYELNNKEGEVYYARFNFRTEQGVRSLTPQQFAVASQDVDYYNRDLYNSITNHTYPSWRLEMDVMRYNDLKHLNYDPFDVSRLWKNGTYHTVTIGRLILNKNPDNYFKVSELSAFNPASLVPGIPGPVDYIFKGRQLFYRDTQNYRLGVNNMKAEVNLPFYAKTYTRDGMPPVRDNMRDAPNYFPNSFKGPVAVADAARPPRRLVVYENNAVDLAQPAHFYKHVLVNDAQRQKFAVGIAQTLATTTEPVKGRALKLLTLVNKDLGRRVHAALGAAA